MFSFLVFSLELFFPFDAVFPERKIKRFSHTYLVFYYPKTFYFSPLSFLFNKCFCRFAFRIHSERCRYVCFSDKTPEPRPTGPHPKAQQYFE